MTNTVHRLAQRLAHSACQLKHAIANALATEQHHGRHGPWQQYFEAFQHTLLPNLTPSEFADMYAQTIVYSLFASHIIPLCPPAFPVVDSCVPIPLCPSVSPVVDSFVQKDTRIVSIIDECMTMLERTNMSEVLRDFGKATMQQDPVVHFYETFLAAYDPKTREMRGVYYTPEPVVSYIVRSVDSLLQTHFGKSLGLADGDTIILDPATGTATFLHAVVQHIYATLHGMGMADAWDTYVAEKLLPRLFGFELLMAPYTIAHLKLNMLLQQLGYTFGSDERLGIYLTNALSDVPTGQHAMLFAQFIAEEGQAAKANDVKQSKPVMVVLGNPPYSNYRMLNRGEWIQDQLKDYKRGLQERKLNLDDDCIKFIRFGQWRIEQTGQGILAFITNNTYIDGLTHRRMRESLMETFTDIYILDLHGSSLKKEICPDGSPDENIFDIRQGVTIGIFVKQPGGTAQPAHVYHAEMWGTRKYKYALLQSSDVQSTRWTELLPKTKHFFFVPKPFHAEDEYSAFSSLQALFVLYQGAIKTDRDGLFFDIDRAVLADRMRVFFSPEGLAPDFRATYRVENSSSYKLLSRRESSTLNVDCIQPCLYRPFDVRWLYYDATGLTSRAGYEVMRHLLHGHTIALLVCRQQALTGFYHVSCSEYITESHAVSLKTREGAFVFPLYLYPNGNEHPDLFDFHNGRRPNLSASFVADVEQRIGLTFIPDGTGDLQTTVGPEDIFHYLYAVLHSPTYRTRYAELLRIDFPHVPITDDKGVFADLAALGAALVDLHLLRLPGNRGVGGAGGAAMLAKPGEQGITQHCTTNIPIAYIRYDAQHQHVYIANDAYFAGIAPDTWNMQIGGYQPLYKWLKDRKGRTLSFDDALHYMRMVIALRETQRIMAEIDVVLWG